MIPFRGVILTPVNSGSFNASVDVTLANQATAIVNKNVVIANLQCVTVQDAVIFSLTFQESITYCTAGGTVITEAFAIPYANTLSVPGTVAGMRCEIAAIINALNVALISPSVVRNTLTFTITAATEFPPPAAQDVDSNIFTAFPVV